MSAKTIVAASKVDDALHKVAACAETLADNADRHYQGNPSASFTSYVSVEHLTSLRQSIKELKDAEETFKALIESEKK